MRTIPDHVEHRVLGTKVLVVDISAVSGSIFRRMYCMADGDKMRTTGGNTVDHVRRVCPTCDYVCEIEGIHRAIGDLKL